MAFLQADVLTDRERLESFRYGFVCKLAEAGVSVGQFDRMAKEAQWRLPSLGDIFKTSIIFGVPIGGLMHVMGRSSGSSVETRKLRNELEYYRDMSSEIKGRLRTADIPAPAESTKNRKDDDNDGRDDSGKGDEKQPVAAAPGDKPKYVDFSSQMQEAY